MTSKTANQPRDKKANPIIMTKALLNGMCSLKKLHNIMDTVNKYLNVFHIFNNTRTNHFWCLSICLTIIIESSVLTVVTTMVTTVDINKPSYWFIVIGIGVFNGLFYYGMTKLVKRHSCKMFAR